MPSGWSWAPLWVYLGSRGGSRLDFRALRMDPMSDFEVPEGGFGKDLDAFLGMPFAAHRAS